MLSLSMRASFFAENRIRFHTLNGILVKEGSIGNNLERGFHF